MFQGVQSVLPGHYLKIAFRRDGIPLIKPVIDDLDKLAIDLGIEPVRRISA